MKVVGLWRHPVKSMQGECLERVTFGPDGLDGDRRFAVIDTETGRVASAKKPRKWASLLKLRAQLRDGVLTVTPPSWRFDIAIEEDLIEEVARVLGYDRLPATPPLAPVMARVRPESQRSPHAVRRALGPVRCTPDKTSSAIWSWRSRSARACRSAV